MPEHLGGGQAVIYLVIPAFNEAEGLRALLPGVPGRLFGHVVSVMVVCDGSTDGTCRVAGDLGAEVLKLDENSGKGAAIKTGASALADRDYDAVVVMDGDGQHRVSDLPAVVRPVLEHRADVSIGSRYAIDSKRGPTPLNRFVVRSVFSRFMSSRLTQPVTDPFSGFRCMSKPAFEAVGLTGDRYEGELEVRFGAEAKGFTVTEVPIRRVYNGAQSKMGATGGRLRVIRGYVKTVARMTRQTTALREQVPVG